jgi:hypothetical protein
VVGGLWTALHYPVAFLILLALFCLLMVWLLPKIWRALKLLIHKLRQFFSGRGQQTTRATQNRSDILKSLYHDASKKPD